MIFFQREAGGTSIAHALGSVSKGLRLLAILVLFLGVLELFVVRVDLGPQPNTKSRFWSKKNLNFEAKM